MGSFKDKVKGHVNVAKGNVKEKAGKVLGDSRLENEGTGEKIKGHAQKAMGDVKDAVKSGIKRAGEAVKKVGEFVEDAGS